MSALIIRSEDDKIRGWIYQVCYRLEELDYFYKIKFEFSNKFRSTFGQAFKKQNLIKLATKLWAVANETQKEWVVAHEVCHLICDKRYGKRSGNQRHHGPLWKGIMIKAGYKPNRCHDVDLKLLKK